MRRRFWQIHSWLGLICGLALLVIGLTGSALVFRQELEAWFNPELVRVVPTAAGRLPVDQLLAAVNQAAPGHEVTGWVIDRDAPQVADLVYVIAHGSREWRIVTVDPYTGEVLAAPTLARATLSGWLLEVHYTFFADHAGMLITGFLAIGLCLLGVTGVWIYRKFWRAFFTLRWRVGARIFFGDVHRMFGISSVAFNLLLGFTGAYWNFTHVIGEAFAEGGAAGPENVAGRMYGDAVSFDALLADASQRLPGFETNYIGLPWVAGLDITLWGSFADAGVLRSPYGSTVTYDAQNGAYRNLADIRTGSAWAQFVDAFRPLHFGDFGGLPVKLLWCLGGLTPGVLALTGSLVWWRRRCARRETHRHVARRDEELTAVEMSFDSRH